jgi:hypothetical protein
MIKGILHLFPEVDLATNVIYGAAGSDLITISLCNYKAVFIG